MQGLIVTLCLSVHLVHKVLVHLLTVELLHITALHLADHDSSLLSFCPIGVF